MIFILKRVSGMSYAKSPVKNDAVFQMYHEGKLFWAVRLETIKDLIGFMKICDEELIINNIPVIEKDGLTCYEITIYDDYIE